VPTVASVLFAAVLAPLAWAYSVVPPSHPSTARRVPLGRSLLWRPSPIWRFSLDMARYHRPMEHRSPWLKFIVLCRFRGEHWTSPWWAVWAASWVAHDLLCWASSGTFCWASLYWSVWTCCQNNLVSCYFREYGSCFRRVRAWHNHACINYTG
jgi:hypothetical protein